MNYADRFMSCPMCGAVAECDAVDVGVGLYLAGNYACRECDWEEYGPVAPQLEMDERPFADNADG